MLKAVQSVHSFAPDVQREVVLALAEAYNLQMRILIGFSALQIFAIAMIWRSGDQIRVVDVKKLQQAAASREAASEVSEADTEKTV